MRCPGCSLENPDGLKSSGDCGERMPAVRGPLILSDTEEWVARSPRDLKRTSSHGCLASRLFVRREPLAGFADPAGFTVADQPRSTRQFLTRKLWDVGNSDPYGHRGDLTTLTEAIHFHGGDARGQRDAFFALAEEDRDAVIEFLRSLVVAQPADVRSGRRARR